MRNIVAFCAFFAIVLSAAAAFAQSTPDESASTSQFRDPFVLKLRIGNDRSFEQHFDRVPFVMGRNVYLFSGDHFGIKVTVIGNQIARIDFQPDSAKADVEFTFTQEESQSGPNMILITRNKLKQKILFDALMTIPEKKDIYKTSILPVEPMLTGIETWPHPIVQLVLRDFRFTVADAAAPR
jgi:hypothetical protein